MGAQANGTIIIYITIHTTSQGTLTGALGYKTWTMQRNTIKCRALDMTWCCSHKTTNCGYLTCSKSTKDQGRQNPSMSGKAFRRSNPYLKMTGNWWDCGHCEIAHGPVDGHTYTHTGTAIRAQRVISKRSQCGSGLCCMCILVDCSEEVEGKTKRCIWSKYIICMSGILKNKEDI